MKRIAFALLLVLASQAAPHAAPGAPSFFQSVVSGNIVVLSWGAASGAITTYRIEAGSAPGLNNVGVFDVGLVTQLSVSAPSGTFYLRVRGVGPDGIGPTSNEIIVTVGLRAAPGAPPSFLASVTGNTVHLTWGVASGEITTYRLEAGTATGLSNIGVFDVGVVTALSVGAAPGFYWARVRAVGPGGVGPPSNEVLISVGGGAPPPPAPTASFGPGQHLVGRTIQPGRYYSVPATGCYWERQRGLSGSLNDVIANEFVGFNAGQWIVDIAASDVAFETDAECGTWFNTPRRGQLSGISPGVWLVGPQVSPGTYSSFVRDGCYWERRRDFSGTVSGIIDNEFVSSASTQFVGILSSDVGFLTDGDCGFWSRSSRSAPVRGSTTQTIERARQLRWERLRQ